jgi:DNA invertase Pin-like site-specific DNA recombinase
MPKRRVVCYLRVSSQVQAEEGVSLAVQRAKLLAYSEAYDLEVVEVIEDAGLSAKNMDRPGLQRALKLLDDGLADALAVLKLDRLTRSVRDLGHLMEVYFSKPTCSLISLNESLSTHNAAGRLVVTMLVGVASWEREICGERTKDALAQLKSEGVRLGRDGYGWKRLDELDSEGRKVVVAVEEERESVARVLDLHQAGLSLRSIAGALTAEGRATKRGGAWRSETVRKIVMRHAPKAASVGSEEAA